MSKRISEQSRKQAKQRIVILLLTMLMITIGSVLFGSTFSKAYGSASETKTVHKYYKSIVIQKGDTLWDIANKYKTDDYENTQEYIDELKQINSLKSDIIHEDQYLMIAYYDVEHR